MLHEHGYGIADLLFAGWLGAVFGACLTVTVLQSRAQRIAIDQRLGLTDSADDLPRHPTIESRS